MEEVGLISCIIIVYLYYGLILNITSFGTDGIVNIVDKQSLYLHRQCYDCPLTGDIEMLVDL